MKHEIAMSKCKNCQWITPTNIRWMFGTKTYHECAWCNFTKEVTDL